MTEIFSVSEVSIWSAFLWEMFALFYAVALLLVIFPRLLKVWPLSGFALLGRNRKSAYAVVGFFSVIAIPHFHMTYVSLRSAKKALSEGQLVQVSASYDGEAPERRLAGRSIPEMALTFDGAQYDVPGSLHGDVKLLPEMRARLVEGRRYVLSVNDGVVLRIVEAEQ